MDYKEEALQYFKEEGQTPEPLELEFMSKMLEMAHELRDNAKDAFLQMLADGTWDIDYDADMTDTGNQIDCSTFHIIAPLSSMREFLETLGITSDDDLEDTLKRAIEEDPSDSA